MDGTIYVILKVLFAFALEVWLNILELPSRQRPNVGPYTLVVFLKEFLKGFILGKKVSGWRKSIMIMHACKELITHTCVFYAKWYARFILKYPLILHEMMEKNEQIYIKRKRTGFEPISFEC